MHRSFLYFGTRPTSLDPADIGRLSLRPEHDAGIVSAQPDPVAMERCLLE